MALLSFVSAVELSHSASLIFQEPDTTNEMISSNSATAGPTTVITVSRKIAISSVGARVERGNDGKKMKILIRNLTTATDLIITSEFYINFLDPASFREWIDSPEFSPVFLEPGNDYVVGYATPSGNGWKSSKSTTDHTDGFITSHRSIWWMNSYSPASVEVNPFMSATGQTVPQDRGYFRFYGVDLADLAIAKISPSATLTPGQTATYTITARNDGPSDVVGARIADNFPTQLNNVSWSCVGIDGGNCLTNSGTGNINALVNLPMNGSVQYTVIADTDPAYLGNVSSEARISYAAFDRADPDLTNNSSTFVIAMSAPVAAIVAIPAVSGINLAILALIISFACFYLNHRKSSKP